MAAASETRRMGALEDIARATEAERRRIAREIHDQLGQMLTALRIDTVRLRTRLAQKARPEPLLPELDAMVGLIDRTIESVRRIAAELRPPLLDDPGLASAIEWQAQEFESRTGLRTRVIRPACEPAIPEPVSTALFRIFQELLTNVARHAGASSLEVRLSASAGWVELEVQDNGRGFSPGQKRWALGLLGIQERVLLLDGSVCIEANPGRGTTVKVRIPLDANPLG